MRRILLYFIIIFSVVSNNISAQSPEIDSLLDILKNAKEDTNKVLILSNLAYELAGYDSENAFQYAKLGIFLGEKLEYKYGLAQCYKAIGVIHYYQENFDQALENYFRCLNFSKEINNIELTSKTLANIGMTYFLQGNYDLANEKYQESLKFEEQIGNDLKIAGLLNIIGILYQEQGKYTLALENYFRSLKIYQDYDHKEEVGKLLNNIGLTYMYQGTYDRALDYFFKSLTITEELKDSTGIALTYDNIGSIYDYQEDLEKALEYYSKSAALFETRNEQYNLATVYDHLGEVYKKNEEINKAREYFLKSLAISQEIGDKSGEGWSFLNIGTAYYQEKNYSDALEYYFKSLEINQEIGDLYAIGSIYKNIGTIYKEQKNYTKALSYLNKAKKISEDIGALEQEKDVAEELSYSYSQIGNYKLAYKNHVRFKEIFDKLKSDENVKSIAQREMQYEFEKRQKIQELEEAQKEAAREAERKRERLIRFIFLIIITFVLVFAFFMLRSYRIIKKSNILLAQQRDQIAHQKEAITDSIIYAKRIQTAVLPSAEYANEILSEHFILFRPRDIVSGDFFWMTQRKGKTIIVAADCTGHGVPGAFMSMLGVSFLNEIVNKNETTQANLILNELRAAVKKTLDQTGKKDEAKDGMDLALCIFDYENNKMQYAGAYNPLYMYRNNELFETKADKMPIGIYVKEKESFTNHEIDLQKGDTFYIFSDGFVDQFGGDKGNKFMSKRFKELLHINQNKSMAEQKVILNNSIENWMGDKHEQLDDICIVGVRI